MCPFDSCDAIELHGFFPGAIEAVAESSENITNSLTFDAFRSLLKYADSLQGSTMNKMLDSITSGLLAEYEAASRDIDSGDSEAITSHRTSLEMYAFLLQWFVSAAEKVKTVNDDETRVEAPPRSRRGRGGKAAAGSRAASKKDNSWTWMDQIPNTLAVISKVLKLRTLRIWTVTPERDVFIKYVHMSIFLPRA